MKSLESPDYFENIKQNLLSGEWFLLFGDSDCVLALVERLRTVTHVLAVNPSKIIVLAKKNDALREILGLSEEITRQIIAVLMSDAGSAACILVTFYGSEDTRMRVVDELIQHLRELSEEEGEPSTTTM